MKRSPFRTTLGRAVLIGGIVMWFVPFSPQAQTASPAGQQVATPAQGGPGEPVAQVPGQPGGRGARGGRGGLGGPQENDPANATADYGPKPPVKVLTPQEQAKKFWLPAGFRMEPVLADPDIEESAQIAFDGNGRMFVLEIRGYMQDADAAGELDPVGRISVHEDRDNDGKSTNAQRLRRQADLPALRDAVGRQRRARRWSRTRDEVWKYTDTNNDGVADKKELFATGFGRLANVEHQQTGLYLGDGQLAVQHRQRRSACAGRRRAVVCASRPAATARSGASRRTTTARSGSRAARAACPATSSSRSSTAISACRTSSSLT